MKFLLSALLLGVVLHAHAEGAPSPGIGFIATHWIAILLTVVALIVFAALQSIVAFIWKHGVSDKWKAMKPDVGQLKKDVKGVGDFKNTFESDASKMKEDIHKLKTTVGKIKKDIHIIKESISKILEKLFPEEQSPTSRNSPLRVTDAGKDIAMKIGADKLFANHWEYLKCTVNATDPHSDYDIEIASIEAAQEMDVVLSDEEKYIIKEEAYSRGIPHEEILSIIGVMLRDKLLEERESTNLKKIQEPLPSMMRILG